MPANLYFYNIYALLRRNIVVFYLELCIFVSSSERRVFFNTVAEQTDEAEHVVE